MNIGFLINELSEILAESTHDELIIEQLATLKAQVFGFMRATVSLSSIFHFYLSFCKDRMIEHGYLNTNIPLCVEARFWRLLFKLIHSETSATALVDIEANNELKIHHFNTTIFKNIDTVINKEKFILRSLTASQ